MIQSDLPKHDTAIQMLSLASSASLRRKDSKASPEDWAPTRFVPPLCKVKALTPLTCTCLPDSCHLDECECPQILVASKASEAPPSGFPSGIVSNVHSHPQSTQALILYLNSYDFIKHKLRGRTLPFVDYQLRDNLLLHVISSCLAGTFATSSSFVASSRILLKFPQLSVPLQTSLDQESWLLFVNLKPCLDIFLLTTPKSCDTGVFQVLTRSLREEGPRFLFKGWTPAFIRLGPNTVLLFVFFEVTLFYLI